VTILSLIDRRIAGHAKRCFVFGNGPSLASVNLPSFADEFTIGANFFLKSGFHPDVICCLDPDGFDFENYKRFRGLFLFSHQVERRHAEYVAILSQMSDVFVSRISARWSDDTELYTPDFTRIRSTGSVLSAGSIPLAAYLGFPSIYMLGCDGYPLPDAAASEPTYFYEVDRQRKRSQDWGDGHLARTLPAAAKLGIEIINLTPRTFITVVPRGRLIDVKPDALLQGLTEDSAPDTAAPERRKAPPSPATALVQQPSQTVVARTCVTDLEPDALRSGLADHAAPDSAGPKHSETPISPTPPSEPESPQRPRRFQLDAVSGLGDALMQLFIARNLLRNCGGGEIVTRNQATVDLLASFGPCVALIDEPLVRPLELSQRIRSARRLAAQIMTGDHFDVHVRTTNIQAVAYPRPARARQWMMPPLTVPMADFADDELIIHLDRAEASVQHGRDQPPLPVSFYRFILQETGLKPIFIGDPGEAGYAAALQAAFPQAPHLRFDLPAEEFAALGRARHLVAAPSPFSFLAAYCSEAKQIFMPLAGAMNPRQRADQRHYPAKDSRYRLFHFPIFYARPQATLLERFEAGLARWREVTPTMLDVLITTKPRFEPSLSDALAVFDEAFYLVTYPAVVAELTAGRVASAADHFAVFGHVAGLRPCAVDPLWYIERYPQAALEVSSGDFLDFGAHYLALGRHRGYLPTPPSPGNESE